MKKLTKIVLISLVVVGFFVAARADGDRSERVTNLTETCTAQGQGFGEIQMPYYQNPILMIF